MKIRLRLVVASFVTIFLLQAILSPTPSVKASTDTNFQVNDTFSFRINNYNLIIEVNDTTLLNSNNYTYISLDEDLDLTITGITEIDPPDSNVTVAADFRNPSLNDPIGTFHVSTEDWWDQVGSGAIVSVLLPALFDPYSPDFNVTVDTSDPSHVNISALPPDTSILFPHNGGKILPFFVSNNLDFPYETFQTYSELEIDTDYSGNLVDGFYNRSTEVRLEHADTINNTAILFQRANWDNQTKLFEFEMAVEVYNFGTYSNGSGSFFAYSDFHINTNVDYNTGVVTLFDQKLYTETNMTDASRIFSYDFAFQQIPYDPQGSTSYTSDSTQTSSTTSSVSTPSTPISSSNSVSSSTSTHSTTDSSGTATDTASDTNTNSATGTQTSSGSGNNTSMGETSSSMTTSSSNTNSRTLADDITSESLVTRSSSADNDTTSSAEVNYSTPLTILLSILMVRLYYIKRK